ncbi:MAG: hypothetical protein WD648_07460 [Planctomycetaceae bacterium]
MSHLVTHLGSILAAAEPSEALKAVEFDLPESTLGWALLIAGPVLLVAWLIVFNVFDTRTLWRHSRAYLLATGWISLLRLCVVAGIVIIAINPQERTRTMSYRRSRVAFLADTTLSMRYAAKADANASTGDAGAGAQSRADAVIALFSKSPLLERLRTRHDVSLYSFDSTISSQPFAVFYEKSLTTSPQPNGGESVPSGAPTSTAGAASKSLDWNEVLRPRGVETRLGESLLEAIRELNGQTLSGIVVVSDGGSNSGIEPSTAHDAARNAKPSVRLVTVGLGSTAQPVNLQIASIQAPTDAHVGDAYDFSAFVQGQGLAGQTVAVELLMKPDGTDEQPVAVESSDQFPNPREVTLREDGIPVEVKFQRHPTVAGTVEYFVRTKSKSQVRELSDEDNERRKTIRVSDRKTRVLVLAGGPMRDYHFVRNMLHRHKGIEMDIWLQTVEPATASRVSQESDNLLLGFPSSAAELFEYDVVVAFDPDWSRLTSDQVTHLNEWVGTHGGGLIVVAGDVFTPELAGASDALDPIRELYPVFLSSYLLNSQYDGSTGQAWPISWTPEGTNAGFLQLEDDAASGSAAWGLFPGVYRCYPTGGARAGATVYGWFTDPRTQTEYGQPVLFAAQYYGSGRTLYVGSPELWRLRVLDEKYYDRFWTKAIREVGQGRLQRGSTRGMLMLDRSQYILGQTVRLRASLLTPQLKPFQSDSVRAEVYEPSGKPITPPRVLLPDKNRPGQFAGDFRANLPGTYRVEVNIPESKEKLSGKIDVVLPNLESDDPRQNVKLLTDLARDTGGRYLPMEELSSLFNESVALRQSRDQASKAGDTAKAGELTAQIEVANKTVDDELAKLLPNRGEEFLIDERLRTLWDRTWLLYLLVGLLSAEWLTRKLLKLA